MRKQSVPLRNCLATMALMGLVAMLPSTASAQTKLPIATFPFPSFSNLLADLILAKGFDKANGFQAEAISYGTGGALWAGVAKGELPVHNMSPYQLQKMRADG